MVRFVKCTEDILMGLQGEEDFTTPEWQECLEVRGVVDAAALGVFSHCWV